jgi:Aspartyl/Asparaginyl beta-hydroxylase
MSKSLAEPREVHDAIVESQRNGKFLSHVISADFDPAHLLEEYRSITSRSAVRHTLRPDGSTLRSVSLTHRPGALEPIYDGNNTQFNPETQEKFFWERDFSVFNEAFMDTAFYDVYQRMPFRVGRMRLHLLPPLTVFTMHKDSAPRAHVVLDTNPNCFLMSGDGQTHHVPADGNVHVYDTTLPHTAFNASREDRVHLIMSLADEEK